MCLSFADNHSGVKFNKPDGNHKRSPVRSKLQQVQNPGFKTLDTSTPNLCQASFRSRQYWEHRKLWLLALVSSSCVHEASHAWEDHIYWDIVTMPSGSWRSGELITTIPLSQEPEMRVEAVTATRKTMNSYLPFPMCPEEYAQRSTVLPNHSPACRLLRGSMPDARMLCTLTGNVPWNSTCSGPT